MGMKPQQFVRRQRAKLQRVGAWAAVASLSLLWLGSGCASKDSQMGVQNQWRAQPAPVFEKGRTTQSEVMQALGPPSQVIGLQDRTLFYYLREQTKTKSLFFVVYNQIRERVGYDRAIFFFDKQGVLTDFAYSKEAIPRDR